jgi:SAM-dependent methyltransferase
VSEGNLTDLAAAAGSRQYDAIVSNDTLYYLDPAQQQSFSAQCRQSLKPDGLLVMNLPALAAFGGTHDMAVGIRKRFDRGMIRALLRPATWDLQSLTYWPFLLSPLVYAVRLRQRMRLRRAPDVPVQSDVGPVPRPVNALLRAATLAENRWLGWKPFGSSLFVVARVAAGQVANSSGHAPPQG